MHRSLSALLGVSLALLLGASAHIGEGAERGVIRRLTHDPDARRADLFEARDEGLVSIRVTPRNERESLVSITNLTDSPLTVEIPKAVVGVHVLKQFQQLPGPSTPFSNDPQNPQQGGAQAVAGQLSGFPQQGPNNNILGNPFGQNFFSIPAEKTVQVKLMSVCIDHGKPTPTTRMTYDLRRLSDYTSNTALVRLFEINDLRTTNRSAVQAAAWNLANDLSFQTLAAKTSGIGVLAPTFSAVELQQARSLVESARNDKAVKVPAR